MRIKAIAALALGGLLCGTSAFAAAPVEALSDLTITNPASATVSQDRSPLDSSPEWLSFEQTTGQGWDVVWTQATGLPHRAIPATYDAAAAAGLLPSGMMDRAARAAALDAAAVDRMSRDLYQTLRTSYPALPPDQDLQYMAIEKKANVWWVAYSQTSNGLRVENARADFRYSADGKLLYLGLDLIPGSLAAASTILDGPTAEQIALDALVQAGLPVSALSRAADLTPVSTARVERDAWVAAPAEGRTTLVFLPVVSADGLAVTPRAAWVVRTQVSDPPARFVSWVDAVTGEILQRENEYHYDTISGHSDSEVQMAEPTDPYLNLAQPHLRVSVAGVGDAVTDAGGDFGITTPDGSNHQVTSILSGPYGRVDDQSGPDPLFQGTATPGVPFSVQWDDGNSQAAERDAFYHVMVEHDYIRVIEPGFTGADYEMPINVNLNETCNAYWDGYSVNFFLAGGGCANTGQIADVVYHEYGHGMNQFTYAPSSPSGSEGEGFSDFIAATITNQPLIGRGFYGPGTSLRTCDNNRQWPAPECGGEVHCVGEVIAGALWHMRVNLVNHLGYTAGVTHSDSLFHFARYGRQQTFDGFYFDILALDDDNGTLADGTPNDTQIIQAFDRHNIGPGWTLDILHTELPDTEEDTNPYPVTAVFSCPADLLADSLGVYYSTQPVSGGPIDGPHRLGMTSTGNIREYQALIPAQPLGTRVLYYLKAQADTLGLVTLDPPGAPGTQHEFIVNLDHTPPTIAHAPLYHKSEAIWPVKVEATVTDNQAVSSVLVEWRLNGVDQTSFDLARQGDTNLYKGMFGGPVAAGDQIQYRIKASDAAQNPNIAYHPILGYFWFNIVHDFVEDGERGTQDWTHGAVTLGFVDQWHISTQRNHTTGGARAWKFGSQGAGPYTDSGDGALVAPPVRISPGAALSFWHWINAESQGSNQAWDGAVVELTNDAGASWTEIIPQGGYTHAIIPNQQSPFPPNYPCWSGSFDWRQAQFDLSAYDGQTIQVRLRFGSDGYVTFEGWYIDDLVLNPGQSSSDVIAVGGLPLRSTLLGNAPNPFGLQTKISFAVAPNAGRISLDVLDVSGRRVRTLIDGPVPPGLHSVLWDGRSEAGRELGSGVYFTRMRTGREEFEGKLLLMK
jgi:hypothetical protein